MSEISKTRIDLHLKALSLLAHPGLSAEDEMKVKERVDSIFARMWESRFSQLLSIPKNK
jgi:hypothetical protein